MDEFALEEEEAARGEIVPKNLWRAVDDADQNIHADQPSSYTV